MRGEGFEYKSIVVNVEDNSNTQVDESTGFTWKATEVGKGKFTHTVLHKETGYKPFDSTVEFKKLKDDFIDI